jgi:ParB family chromosome partitioning protein
MKNDVSDEDFAASLRAQLQPKVAAKTGTPMVMTKPPIGPSKSLEELISGNKEIIKQPSKIAFSGDEEVLHKLPVNLIDDSPWQPRTKYDEGYIQALGAMLEDRGQSTPIMVRQMPSGRFELIAGHRRVRAARLIGWSSINASIVALDDHQAELGTLVSNEGHQGLTEYEKGKSYQRALDRGFAHTLAGVGRLFGCSQGRVSQCISLVNLPVPVIELLDKYPGLFGYRYAKTVKDLFREFPSGADTIVLGIEKLIDDAELDGDNLRSYVEKSLLNRTRAKPASPTIVADPNGVSLFSVKVTDHRIIIDIKENFDSLKAGKKTLSALRELAAELKKLEI